MITILEDYEKQASEREASGIAPKPLNENQVKAVTGLISDPPEGKGQYLLNLLTNRVPPGVDPAAGVKAAFLNKIAIGKISSPVISREDGVSLLGTMLGGYNVGYLVAFLDDPDLAAAAATALGGTLLVFDAFAGIMEKYESNEFARKVVDAWADGLWFTERPQVAEKITYRVFKVDGEINTDDFSPAEDAWSRPDIPLHAMSMLKNRVQNPLDAIESLKTQGAILFAGDVVGTGSSRKSAANSLLWHIGDDIPNVPNKRRGGLVLGSKIAPIFFNTMEDAGALPIECDTSRIAYNDLVSIYPYEGKIVNEETGKTVSEFVLKTQVLLDEVRAGGRIPLIIGRSLTEKARKALGLDPCDFFRTPASAKDSDRGFTQAQKIVGKACSLPGVRPGAYCEPEMATVASQDTTGPMTRDELMELACMKFSAGLVMQSFCHTAAYPKPVDIKMHKSLPSFFRERGGVVLKPGDGVVHSWINRMILPDTVGTGGDSHTRFPLGLSFPAGSGLVAFAGAMGMMPLDMPESVLVRFKGKIQPGITIRDLVNSIPWTAIKKGLLTVEKEGKKNVFSGRILEIEGLPDLAVEKAFELTDASAERSAAAGCICLNPGPVKNFLKKNIAILQSLVEDGYGDKETINSRIHALEKWLKNPSLLKPDSDAEYAEVIEIDLDEINEPILACPNDPDDVRLLSQVAGSKIDEVFIGSCMTSVDHFYNVAGILEGKGAVTAKLWLAPPTRMDSKRLREEGKFSVFCNAGARIEVPGCSLCMGNQARVGDNARVFSTSTRNFPNRMGNGAGVYLGSPELGAICALLGRIPGLDEYSLYMRSMMAS